MNRSTAVLGVGLVAAVCGPAGADPEGPGAPPPRPTIPYVATRHDAVRDMLWLADVGKDDVVYDLGSGDGRIAIAAVRDSGARRAVGIEIDPRRVRESRENAERAGLSDRIEFIEADLFASETHEATVLALYLGHKANLDLRARIFRTSKPGTRVVSHQFGMGEWEPDKTLVVKRAYLGMWDEWWNPFATNARVPDYTAHDGSYDRDTLCMWVVPAPIAGIWRGRIETSQGPRDLTLTFHQRLSTLTGSFRILDPTGSEGSVLCELWGDHLRFQCNRGQVPYGWLRVMFDGHVHGDAMRGTLAVEDDGGSREAEWEARRDAADFTGTWEWPCATDPRPVNLRIERREGRLVAAYTDRGQSVPVTDFYDFGGGFYFTLMIGRTRLPGGEAFTFAEGAGWLIGEAVLDDGSPRGEIGFYPYAGWGSKKWVAPVTGDWTPRSIERTRDGGSSERDP
ncbi:MAG: methyltransferase domain-containing protein [Planctomycetes bacterium]|nr:methyltransferase domain-containing protein [Planctomycetota bacterium]